MTPNENKFVIDTELTFSNVMRVWNDSLLFMQQQTVLHFDFSKVRQVDSAGLALILEWASYARSADKKIVFHSIPTSLASMAEVAGVTQFLE